MGTYTFLCRDVQWERTETGASGVLVAMRWSLSHKCDVLTYQGLRLRVPEVSRSEARVNGLV